MHIVDYLLVIALDEEYRSALATLSDIFSHRPIIKPQGPVVSMLSVLKLGMPQDEREELLVAVSPGRMGHAAIAAVLPDVINRWRPRDIILIGISGSLDSKDLLLGDVIVPMKVFGYAEAKVERVGGKENWAFRTLGDRPASHARTEIQAISDTPELLSAWQKDCRRAGSQYAQIAERIAEMGGDRPKIHIHPNDSLATGNVVVASKQFGKELQTKVSPTIRAVDMEAGGLFEALTQSDWRGSVLVLRGISDYSDKAKSRLERTSKDRWRLYAMQNAVRLAASLIRQRPVWESKRCSVSSPYELSLKPEPGSVGLCAGVGIQNGLKGGVNAAFTPLFRRDASAPELDILVEVIKERSPGDVRLLLRQRPEPWVEVRCGMSAPGKLQITKAASVTPYSVDLFFSASCKDSLIRVTIKDEFRREISAIFPATPLGATHVV